jgi:2-polyprenyl-3-methyl-5-hydroxy-6-metoxy-1,4-benzoquinol methylase
MVYVRANVVRIVDRGDDTTVIGKVVRRFSGDSAALVRAVLEICARPVTREQLLAELAERAGGVVPVQPVDQLLEMLAVDHVLVEPRELAPPALLRRVVLGVTGAVAAVDTPALVRGLHASGCDVRIAMSRNARRFVAPAALEAIAYHPALEGLFDARARVPHIELAEWAEVVVVCPATATTIARIATGDCSDLVAAVACATRGPVIVAPSMNDAMHAAPAVQRNLDTLRSDGRWVIHPAVGAEVAHAPERRMPMLGPAPPSAAVLDVIRHVLGQLAPALPCDAASWERLWAHTARPPWHADVLEPALADALGSRAGRLLDLGCGDGTVAIEAARRGFRVTATDVAPTALARARARAGDLPILFALDDVTASRLDSRFDVAVDRGLLHCLPREAWPAYARTVGELVAPGGELLVVAHRPGSERGTTAITEAELARVLPAFQLERAVATTLAGGDAQLYIMRR